MNILFGQLGHQRAVVGRVALFYSLVLSEVYFPDLVNRGETSQIQGVDVHCVQLDEGGNPHHEELVHIALGDAQKVKPFQQWIFRVAGFFQHPVVKVQPAELPIGVVGCILEIYLVLDFCHASVLLCFRLGLMP